MKARTLTDADAPSPMSQVPCHRPAPVNEWHSNEINRLTVMNSIVLTCRFLYITIYIYVCVCVYVCTCIGPIRRSFSFVFTLHLLLLLLLFAYACVCVCSEKQTHNKISTDSRQITRLVYRVSHWTARSFPDLDRCDALHVIRKCSCFAKHSSNDFLLGRSAATSLFQNWKHSNNVKGKRNGN